jgi:hypothetical protein
MADDKITMVTIIYYSAEFPPNKSFASTIACIYCVVILLMQRYAAFFLIIARVVVFVLMLMLAQGYSC